MPPSVGKRPWRPLHKPLRVGAACTRSPTLPDGWPGPRGRAGSGPSLGSSSLSHCGNGSRCTSRRARWALVVVEAQHPHDPQLHPPPSGKTQSAGNSVNGRHIRLQRADELQRGFQGERRADREVRLVAIEDYSQMVFGPVHVHPEFVELHHLHSTGGQQRKAARDSTSQPRAGAVSGADPRPAVDIRCGRSRIGSGFVASHELLGRPPAGLYPARSARPQASDNRMLLAM